MGLLRELGYFAEQNQNLIRAVVLRSSIEFDVFLYPREPSTVVLRTEIGSISVLLMRRLLLEETIRALNFDFESRIFTIGCFKLALARSPIGV